MPAPYYITTPIYYVNDRPHLGHCYTTLLADAAARFQRLLTPDDRSVFFLTGTDEHADKVVSSAAAHELSPQAWADRNALEFRAAFDFMGCAYDDFIRTTEARHTEKVVGYIRELMARGDVYLGDYQGWYDETQEEYLTETAAREADFKSPVTGRPLVRRAEKNYFFNLPRYQERLLAHIGANPGFIAPEARRNEVLGRLREGLQAVPISRAVTADPGSRWGIRMPDDPGHRIYVWIDALFNYLTAVDTPERAGYWPARVHLIAKDILWFHAVIWPCLLMALDRPLPGMVYTHSYWVREGRKMSKSLGNFVTLEVLKAYAARYGLDAVRWYLLVHGPLGVTDADFAHGRFVEAYNADLANGIGNCSSRVTAMIQKYFEGAVPAPPESGLVTGAPASVDWRATCARAVAAAEAAAAQMDLAGCLRAGTDLVSAIDRYIGETRPFGLAKAMAAGGPTPAQAGLQHQLATILYNCAEALRIAAILLSPAMPGSMGRLLARLSVTLDQRVPLAELAAFDGPAALRPGTRVLAGEPLFARADPAEAAPAG
ncbi:MAG TPA: methionine--tRNA ligase [Phycisphaerales bacterium]|nr:methionine--tRNA ligase [Phycisphaerales bacterium]